MSHNITTDAVRVTDIDTFEQVIADLAGEAATLVRNASTFKTFPGQKNHCDHAVQMADGSYGIGLRDENDGSFSLHYDPYGMTPGVFGEGRRAYETPTPGAAIGKLTTEYGLREAEYTAAQASLTTERISNDDGTISLAVTGAFA